VTDRELDTGTPELLARVERGVGVVVLNRPERRNALTPALLRALAAVLPAVAADDEVGAILLTGAGPGFCAGGDVKDFARRGGAAGGDLPLEEQIREQQHNERATLAALRESGKPTVAALPGAGAGAGLGLALACDLRIGCPTTVFVTAFGKVGLPGDYGAAWLLTHLLGSARARRMLLLGDAVDAGTAREWGLLDRFVDDPGQLPDAALDLAAGLAAGPRLAHAAMKQNLLDAERLTLHDAIEDEVRRHKACGTSPDHLAAIAAFTARTPVS
jgi:2-(1,2-epoxy-1,2-dihydrophenyl)acetyl-CoA isomerase